jgi:hypothetical protein
MELVIAKRKGAGQGLPTRIAKKSHKLLNCEIS